jgi:dihydropteroate synthase
MDQKSTASSPSTARGHRIRFLPSGREAGLLGELRALGVHPGDCARLVASSRPAVLLLEGLPGGLAPLLAGTMRELGGDAAVPAGPDPTAAVVCGSAEQVNGLRDRLHDRTGLQALGEEIAAGLAAGGRTAFTLRLGSRQLELGARTAVMGIVNVTPDSFSDGGKYLGTDAAVEHGLRLAGEGADILDVGGESTRPGAAAVSAEEELRRVVPVIEGLAARTAVPISVDTTKAAVARAALAAGATLVNDVSALRFDPALAGVVVEADAALVVMHMQGEPRTMQRDPAYGNLVGEVVSELRQGVARAVDAGVGRDRILVDPGIGFGKTLAHNLELLARLAELRVLGLPILLGPSRKAFIGKLLDLPAEARLEGTIAACCLGAAHGAHVVRVHDVGPVRRALRVADAIRGGAA